MPRFVLLEHRRDGVHWDFMLEAGDALRTWAIDMPIAAGVDLPARALPDHRSVYLEYEGEVSGSRGSVTRRDRGTYEPILWEPGRVRVDLRGDRLIGRVDLLAEVGPDQREGAAGGWTFRFEAGNPD